MKPLLVILIDAFKYDYLSERNTPFLYTLSKQYPYRPLNPILGYSDAIQATIFTGAYPQEHNYWIKYKYSPETSPFRFFKYLGFIDYLPCNFIIRSFKLILSVTICKLLAKIFNYAELGIHNIPFRIIPYFDYSLKKSLLTQDALRLPTIFDMLRKRNISWSYIDTSKFNLWSYFVSSVKVRRKLIKILIKASQDTQVFFIYLHQLDSFSHHYGIESVKFLQELKNIDETVRMLINKLKTRFPDDLNVIILSDHGMSKTDNFVDLRHLLKDRGLGRDYLLFLDSTMVRIWYLNNQIKEKIRERFNNLGYGAFLSLEEKKELKLNFKNRDYGDDIYLLRPPYSIFPNFISYLRPYAMHAYHPNDESQKGMFMLLNSNNIKTRKEVELIDIAPTILSILGLDKPVTLQGEALNAQN